MHNERNVMVCFKPGECIGKSNNLMFVLSYTAQADINRKRSLSKDGP